MIMIVLFWVLTILSMLFIFIICALWLKHRTSSVAFMVGLVLFCYSGYYFKGRYPELKNYYSLEQQQKREQKMRLQPLFTEVKKQEYKLRFHLEEFPHDTLAESQLHELLGLQALQMGDKVQARQHFQAARDKLLPSSPEKIVRIEHLNNLIRAC